jgi:hypothetical protein
MGQINPVYGSIVPSLQQQILNSNYLNFANGGGNDFAQQYLPEVYEAEVERYGNRTLSGFLRMVGAEMPMTSDQVIWSEQNLLHRVFSNKCWWSCNRNYINSFYCFCITCNWWWSKYTYSNNWCY